MKYRVQFKSNFDETTANNIMNHIESIKGQVYTGTGTPVPIVHCSCACDEFTNTLEVNNTKSSVDFSDPSTPTHSNTGDPNIGIAIDISFTELTDFDNFISYLNSVKPNSINDGYRYFRHFECKHDESPLTKDGEYIYISF